ncbi:hypothetical protein GYH30_050511 [Glycine max]|nr:hypothetical protein GYH30_050511 [Glycine max]
MHKALQLNAPLPYPHLVTLFLQYFNIPLDSEPYVPIMRYFLIGVAMVASFAYAKSVMALGFDGLQTYVGERFDSLERQVDTRFKEINSRTAKVEEDVTIIRDYFDLPPPPPSV